MKKNLLLVCILIFAVFHTNAQNNETYNPIKVDVSLGYAKPSGTGAKAGGLIAVEPKYEIINNLSLGLRMEIAIMARGVNGSGSSDLEIKGSGSYLLTGDYYFSSDRSFRPFVGAGLGLFRLAAGTTANGGSNGSSASSKFGEMVRGGVELGQFRIGVEYNIVPDAELAISSTSKATFKNSYLGIKIGVCFGGRKK